MATTSKDSAKQQSFVQRHSLTLVLAAILLVQTVVSLYTGRHVFLVEAEALGTDSSWSEFWIWFVWEYNLTLLADTFGVILIVLLSKRLVETGSAESKDNPEESR